MTTAIATRTPAPITQADSDDTLIALWLHGRSDHTTRAYTRDIAAFRGAVAKPLLAVTSPTSSSTPTGSRPPASHRHRRRGRSRRSSRCSRSRTSSATSASTWPGS